MPSHTILIVDDERHVTHLLRYKMDREGFGVIAAHDGTDAYTLACEHRPSLVVTDFQMRKMSGLELAMKLRETSETEEIPVIMITGRGHKITPAEMMKTNIRYLLPKPFSPRELMQHVREVLGIFSDDAGATAA